MARAISVLAMLIAGCATRVAPIDVPRADPETVAEWALGRESRAEPPPMVEAYLAVLPSGGQPEAAERLSRQCVTASSVLPAPAGDPRLFFLVDKQLHIAAKREAKPVPLKGADPAVKISQLLAVSRAASPMLVIVTAAARAEQSALWRISVGESTVEAMERVTMDPRLSDRETFFRQFQSPRCLAGGSRCLVLTSHGGHYLIDVEARRGSPTTDSLFDLGSSAVYDVAWAAVDGSALYLLKPCERGGE